MNKNQDDQSRSDPHPNPPHKGEGMTTNLYIRLTKWLSIAGCLLVFIFLVRRFPINDNPDLAEEYGSMIMIVSWITYCVLGAGASSLVCWLFRSRQMALPFIMAIELIILLYLAKILPMMPNSTDSELLFLELFSILALPLVLGWSLTVESSPSPLWGGPKRFASKSPWWGSLGG
jgi:hypothetical protein